jgi:transposase
VHTTIADLLRDLEPTLAAAWLRDYPEVEIVARDQADGYDEGVRQGALMARHVADRWHLLRSLRSSCDRQSVKSRCDPRRRFRGSGAPIEAARADHAALVPFTAMQQ